MIEPNAWSNDFSYDYYIKLLNVAENNFELCLISDAERVLKIRHKKPVLFLRHDLDVSVEGALDMAKFEFNQNIYATYYVRLNTEFYSLKDTSTFNALQKILDLGHEIGLHYDYRKDPSLPSCFKKLESLTGKPVRSLAFHIPISNQLRMNGLKIHGRMNAYSSELMGWYISDSSGRFRDGEPIPQLRNPKGSILQVLIHPVWWGKKVIPSSKKEMIIKKLKNGW
ncbi:MAG: hypothetical protein ABSG49_01120 [Methanoregula sp.]|jgi:hypothetical protein|uniref:hypothetical protein n=1 Tax=Methanoregula sp. TaxID=2052170 RepID=UPI003C160AFE